MPYIHNIGSDVLFVDNNDPGMPTAILRAAVGETGDVFRTEDGSNTILEDVFVSGDHYVGGMYAGALAPIASVAAQAIATAGTITPTAALMRVAPAAAVTGVVLAAPPSDIAAAGAVVTVVNEAAAGNSVAFSASVANGPTLAGGTAASFVYNPATGLWYHLV